jgi:hypothetical protein
VQAAEANERSNWHVTGGECTPMLPFLRASFIEVLGAVAPLTAFVTFLQFTIVHAPDEIFIRYLAGSALAVVGMTLLFSGIEYGILPMGRYLGAALPGKESLLLIAIVAFALGFAATVAEPDVLVLAGQVDAASEGSISRQMVVYVIGLGVAIFAMTAMLRIVTGWRMKTLLALVYALAIGLALLAPAEFVPLAFDSGGVTTGVLSAPVMISLALGLSSVLAGRSAASDGFGLLGLASVGPIIAILILSRLLP